MTTTLHRRANAEEQMTKSARRMVGRAAGGALLVSAVVLGTGGPAAATGESVTATPDSNLADTAFVNLSGAGFGADTTVLVEQCAEVSSVTRCSEVLAEVETNLSGAFGPLTLQVTAVFNSDIGPVECRTGCRIEVRNATFPGLGQDGITFARYSSK